MRWCRLTDLRDGRCQIDARCWPGSVLSPISPVGAKWRRIICGFLIKTFFTAPYAGLSICDAYA
jgi:hypothetical protein